MSIPRSASDSALISLAASSAAGNVMKPFAATSVAGKVKTNPSSSGTSQFLVVTQVVTQVVPPTMSGINVEGGENPYEIAFTGDKPNLAWTQLVNQAVLDIPNQLHLVGSKRTAAYNLRRAGFDTMFQER